MGTGVSNAQAKDVEPGDHVRSTSGAVWLVEAVVRRDGMTYATGHTLAGVQFSLAKKDHWPITIA
jgi:hypothetical protein